MADDAKTYESYTQVKGRLDEIATRVADESIPLDDALDLYEEAVALALRASELIETDEEGDDAEGDSPQGGSLDNEQGAAPNQE